MNFDKVIIEQIEYACKLLKKMEHLSPVIAGSSIWSWCSNEPARDIDIFYLSKELETDREAVHERKILNKILKNERLKIKRNYFSTGYCFTNVLEQEEKNMNMIRHKFKLNSKFTDKKFQADFVPCPYDPVKFVKEEFDYKLFIVGLDPKKNIIIQDGLIPYKISLLDKNMSSKQNHRPFFQLKEKFKSCLGDEDLKEKFNKVIQLIETTYENTK